MVQATVEVRRTHTPDSRADSAFSAMARMASPHDENRTNAASAERHERGHDEREHVAGREEERADVNGPVRRAPGTAGTAVLGRMKGKQREQEQHLGQADGGHHDHDPGPLEQPPQHELGQRAGRGGQRQSA